MVPHSYLHSVGTEIRSVWILTYCIGDYYATLCLMQLKLNELFMPIMSDLSLLFISSDTSEAHTFLASLAGARQNWPR